MKKISQNYIDTFFKEKPEEIELKKSVEKALDMLTECIKSGKKILVCGNGGSAADSEHIAGELLKSFTLKRPISESLKSDLINNYGEEGAFIADNIQGGIKCLPLVSFSAFSTAFLNDCNEKMLFAQLVNSLGDEGDVLISISTSGNSKNVCYATQLARVKKLKVIALTGYSGGKLKDLCDVLLNVNSNVVYKIQELHLPIYHLLCLCLENEIFDV